MATKTNISIDQGATFSLTVTLTDSTGAPLNLTGYSGASQMRKHYTSTQAKSFGVSLGGANGTISLTMSANATANIVPGRYLYDVELTDTANNITRVFEGIVTVNPNITR